MNPLQPWVCASWRHKQQQDWRHTHLAVQLGVVLRAAHAQAHKVLEVVA